jgi:response regulator of citrate/malate metabolism
VIIFTALSDNEKRTEAELDGATEYILKPDLFEHLELILSKYL